MCKKKIAYFLELISRLLKKDFFNNIITSLFLDCLIVTIKMILRGPLPSSRSPLKWVQSRGRSLPLTRTSPLNNYLILENKQLRGQSKMVENFLKLKIKN